MESIFGIGLFDNAVELCKVSGIAPHAMDENKEVCGHRVQVKGRETRMKKIAMLKALKYRSIMSAR
jgi:hypothetical protein